MIHLKIKITLRNKSISQNKVFVVPSVFIVLAPNVYIAYCCSLAVVLLLVLLFFLIWLFTNIRISFKLSHLPYPGRGHDYIVFVHFWRDISITEKRHNDDHDGNWWKTLMVWMVCRPQHQPDAFQDKSCGIAVLIFMFDTRIRSTFCTFPSSYSFSPPLSGVVPPPPGQTPTQPTHLPATYLLLLLPLRLHLRIYGFFLICTAQLYDFTSKFMSTSFHPCILFWHRKATVRKWRKRNTLAPARSPHSWSVWGMR